MKSSPVTLDVAVNEGFPIKNVSSSRPTASLPTRNQPRRCRASVLSNPHYVLCVCCLPFFLPNGTTFFINTPIVPVLVLHRKITEVQITMQSQTDYEPEQTKIIATKCVAIVSKQINCQRTGELRNHAAKASQTNS